MKRRIFRISLLILGFIMFAEICTAIIPAWPGSKVYAVYNGSTKVTFPESTSRDRSKTITIPNLVRVTSVTVDTGNVSYSVSGNNVTINVSNGSSVRTERPSQYVTGITKETGENFPPNTYNYTSGSYSGTLNLYDYTNNGYYDVVQMQRTFTKYQNNIETKTYDKDGKLIKVEYSLGDNNNPYYHVNEDGYEGDIPLVDWWVSGPTRTTLPGGGFKEVRTYTGKYVGTLTKEVLGDWHDVYTGYYRGYIYGPTEKYYAYNVTVSYVSNLSPGISVISPVNNQLFSEASTAFIPVVSVSDPDGDTLTCKVFIDSESAPRDTKTVSNTATAQTVSFSALNLGALTEGTHTMRFTVYDGEASAQAVVYFSVDKTSPVLGAVNFSSTDSSITISGSATDSFGMHSAPYAYVINGSESQWTTQKSYTAGNLTPNTLYTVGFKARDNAGHVTVSSGNIYTKAVTPSISVNSVSETSLVITAHDSNPPSTQYLISCGAKYLSNTGMLTTTAEWITLQNKSITVKGLEPNKVYVFTAKARNGELAETAVSNQASGRTLACPPSVLNFSNITSDSITVSWPAVQEATGYDIEVDGQLIDNKLSTSFVHSGLQPETPHTYRVRVRNAGGTGSWTELQTRYTLPIPPGTPGNIKAEAGIIEITVTWDAVADATGYEIEVDGTVQDVGASLSFTHTGLEPDTMHEYRVSAKNEGGRSSWSDKLYVRTLPAPPAPPQEIGTVITKNTITVSWEQLFKADRYEIEVDGYIYDNGTSTSFLHEGLIPLTKHTYRIRGINAGGTGEWSRLFEVTTHPYEPEMPANVMATANGDAIILTWQMSAFAWSYEVEIDGSRVEETTGISFEHSNLLPGSSHTYRIRAKNISGVSDWTSPVTLSVIPEGGSIGLDILNAAAVVNYDSIILSWDASAFECEYEVEVDGVLKDNGSSTVFAHTSLLPGTYHTYRVRVKNAENENDWSVVLTLSTLPEPPDAPRIIDSFATNNMIRIWWEPVEGAVSYDVEVDGEIIRGIEDITFQHKELLPGTAHRYRVRARTMLDISPWSALLEISTSNNTYEIEVKEGEEFSFALIADYVQDFTGLEYVIEYDPDQLELVDLCELTPEDDLVLNGKIPETDLSVVREPGIIRISVDKNLVPGRSWSGEITTIVFRAKLGCTTYINLRDE